MKISDYTEDDIPPELAKEVYQMMDACNASGIIKSFGEVMTKLWDHAHKNMKGTEWVNSHPLVTIFIDKLVELNNGNVYHAMELIRRRMLRKE